jgi:hypothetical protein
MNLWATLYDYYGALRAPSRRVNATTIQQMVVVIISVVMPLVGVCHTPWHCSRRQCWRLSYSTSRDTHAAHPTRTIRLYHGTHGAVHTQRPGANVIMPETKLNFKCEAEIITRMT